jgi:hypothetical protein
VRVFDAVEYHDEGVLSSPGSDDVIEITVLLRGCDRYDALMCGIAGHAVQLSSLQEAHGHSESAAVFD